MTKELDCVRLLTASISHNFFTLKSWVDMRYKSVVELGQLVALQFCSQILRKGEYLFLKVRLHSDNAALYLCLDYTVSIVAPVCRIVVEVRGNGNVRILRN